jgi:hypothetical protein
MARTVTFTGTGSVTFTAACAPGHEGLMSPCSPAALEAGRRCQRAACIACSYRIAQGGKRGRGWGKRERVGRVAKEGVGGEGGERGRVGSGGDLGGWWEGRSSGRERRGGGQERWREARRRHVEAARRRHAHELTDLHSNTLARTSTSLKRTHRHSTPLPFKV